MYYLIIQLYKENFIDDMLLALTTAGIENGTVVDGVNMDNYLNQRVPLFTGLIPNVGEDSEYCKIISSIIDSKKKAENFLKVLKEADIDFEKDNIGRIVLLPAEILADGME
ncbi:MAG: hypothetical protein FXF47_09215 [Candidatus Mcinerneyibacterium aminivorans]|uniref:P-II family nitrogen regulator n=1 Tax=Candidatus Mcinerneyibacterium aminivorans TaxID=2703815 RepID=A0A5D0MEX7_9BACT|nr:MAG: hypothetical protein FXF47_09215 [Candidatus Mcinerneyibacterium aminivorans]